MKKYKSYSLLQGLVSLFLCFFLLLNFSSCLRKVSAGKAVQSDRSLKEPDYSDLYYWASHPWKKDPADKVPLPLKDRSNDSIADVFFIHPTTYTQANMSMGWNAQLNEETLNNKTDNSTILYQASVFNEQSRIFAPRYRQAHLRAFYTTDKNAEINSFDLAYNDIKSAFEHYLKNYNHGRPVIIASHSQGTLHAAKLLKEYFESKPLQNQLVCAYLIGLPVFTDYFNEIKPCTNSTSTGCFVSWRTFKNGYEPLFVKNEKNAYVTNPLTWSLSPDFASASLNKGGILKNFDRVIPGVVSAQVHGNILWTNTPQFFGNILLITKNYHIGDINLFYVNIRDNVRARITSFMNRAKTE
jgi:hypothetical protein